MAIVFIPTPLRKFTGNTSKLDISGHTVREVIDTLSSNFPELKRHLLNADGRIPSFINVFVNDDDIRNLQQEQTPVEGKTIVSIVPAIAGGSK
ncbi:MAG: MoaD/ThiS family protein [Chryseolinea sp.]